MFLLVRTELINTPERMQWMIHIRIDEGVFQRVWGAFGPFSFDLMASPANAVNDNEGNTLRFFSRYWTEGCQGADLLSQNISGWDNLYCFPPLKMVSVSLQFLRESGAHLYPSRCERIMVYFIAGRTG